MGALTAGIFLNSVGLSHLNGRSEPSELQNPVATTPANPGSSPTPTVGPSPSPRATPSPIPTPAKTPPPEASEGSWLIVTDISEQKLYLYDGRKLFRQYSVSTGKESTPTPLGKWRISEKVELRLGTEYGSRWMRLAPFDPAIGNDYGIHGTNEDNRIGTPVSAGCIRLHNVDVEEIYVLVPIGTLVLTVQ